MRSQDPVILPRRAAEMLEAPPPGCRWPDRIDRWWDVGGVMLTEEEYLRAQAQIRREEGCNLSIAKLSQIGGDDVRFQALSCGQRRCEACGFEAREYARRRLATSDIYHGGIEWRMFVTLTMPRSAYQSKEEAWKSIGRVMSAWCRGVQKMYRGCKIDGRERAQIGWAIEAHADGWPHVHVVLDMEYPARKNDARLLNRHFRALWNAEHGVQYSIVQTEKPRSRHRAGDYLSKYIAKMKEWGEGLLALMYRKRMWASTLPRIPTMIPAPPKWQVIEILSLQASLREMYSLKRRGFRVEGDPQGYVARMTEEARAQEDFWTTPAGELVRSMALEGREAGERWIRRLTQGNPDEWRPGSAVRGSARAGPIS